MSSAFFTQPFAEMLWLMLSEDEETITDLINIFAAMNNPADRKKLFEIIKLFYALTGVQFPHEVKSIDQNPISLSRFISSFIIDLNMIIDNCIEEIQSELKNLSEEAKLLVLNNVSTMEDLLQMRSGLEGKISELCTERNEYRNMIRRIGTPAEGKEALREQIAEIGRDLKSCRRQICLCDSILSRTAELEKKIEAAEKELKKERAL